MDRGTNASMTGEQRADLERIAFGRTHTPEDEDAAAAAREELAEADRAELAAVRGAAVAAARAASQEQLVPSQAPTAGSWSLGSTSPDDGLLPPPPPEAPRKAGRRIRPAWLLPSSRALSLLDTSGRRSLSPEYLSQPWIQLHPPPANLPSCTCCPRPSRLRMSSLWSLNRGT